MDGAFNVLTSSKVFIAKSIVKHPLCVEEIRSRGHGDFLGRIGLRLTFPLVYAAMLFIHAFILDEQDARFFDELSGILIFDAKLKPNDVDIALFHFPIHGFLHHGEGLIRGTKNLKDIDMLPDIPEAAIRFPTGDSVSMKINGDDAVPF
jgi:hypothetical protein